MAAKGAGCQQTVFTLLKNTTRTADQYYRDRNFYGALQLYSDASQKQPGNIDLKLKLARCHYALKEYNNASRCYEAYATRQALPPEDLYLYAESQAALGKYESAISQYRRYLALKPDSDLAIRKIWRLNNVKYLFEDSMHYAVRPLTMNSPSGDLCAVLYRKDLVFMSNRKQLQLVEKVDGSKNAPFYQLYLSKAQPDTSGNGSIYFEEPQTFARELSTGLHIGPVSFYDDFTKMVFTSNAVEIASTKNTLQLFFAELIEGVWKIREPFRFNSSNFSVSDPAIDNDGSILYFSSDMPGGFGGKDLYRSHFTDGRWSEPENLGEKINTPGDESFPYVHKDKYLYFSSNGHPGMGGLDIFRASLTMTGFDEAQNAGYPLNSTYDDFGIMIDSLDSHGYFSSNRKNGGYNDDLYEFDMDLQTYPVTITGTMRFKEHNWTDTSALHILPHASIELVDNLRNMTVEKSSSDGSGNFTIVIPYFSKYSIRVKAEDGEESMAILQIPKQRKEMSSHQIVIVKDFFRIHENHEVK
jgi:hypothetical protein